jgi:hypothetical protein
LTQNGESVTKQRLVEKIKEILRTDSDLHFLLELGLEEIETLIAGIRDRVDRLGEDSRTE